MCPCFAVTRQKERSVSHASDPDDMSGSKKKHPSRAMPSICHEQARDPKTQADGKSCSNDHNVSQGLQLCTRGKSEHGKYEKSCHNQDDSVEYYGFERPGTDRRRREVFN